MGTSDEEESAHSKVVSDADEKDSTEKRIDHLSDILDQDVPENLAKLIDQLRAIKPRSG